MPEQSVNPEDVADLLLRYFSPEDISKIPGLNISFQPWDDKPPDTIEREEFDRFPEKMRGYLTDKAEQSKGLPPYDYNREYAQEEPEYQEEGLDFPYVEEKDRVVYNRSKGKNPAGFVKDTYHMPPEAVEDQKRKEGFQPTSKESLRGSLVEQLSKKFGDFRAEHKKLKQKEDIKKKYKEEMAIKKKALEKSYAPPSPLRSTTYPELPEYIRRGIPEAREQLPPNGGNHNIFPSIMKRTIGY